jgi:hypothetical protein
LSIFDDPLPKKEEEGVLDDKEDSFLEIEKELKQLERTIHKEDR